MPATIDVLVVDDSPLMQRLITQLLESDPTIRVISTASDGYEAIEKVASLHPDVITLDIEMPRMNGLDALRHIMATTPTPIIILSGALEKDTAIHALESGAVEVMTKPSGTISIDLYKIREALIKKVKIATLVNVNRITGETGPIFPTTSIPKNTALNTPWTLAIGASTGGPRALNIILSNLPARLPAHVLIVQHMPSTFTASFAQRLDKHSPLHVVEAQHGQTITPGAAYVAPGGIHMLISENNKQPVIALQDSPPVNSVCPSVDVLMNSVAQWAGSRSLGVLLTGMGSDGAEGLAQIQATGGYTIAQDKATSTIFGMPRAAIKRKVVNEVLPLKAIPQAIVKIILEGKDHD